MRSASEDRRATSRSPLSYFVNGGLSLGVGVTFAGFLAPWWPVVELVNHFRPSIVLGAGLLVLLSLLARNRRLIWSTAAFFGLSTILLLIPFLLYDADVNPAAERHVRVATLNTWIERGQAERIKDFVDRADPDILLLQEVGGADRAALLEDLAEAYPHLLYDESVRFGPALLSKRPWAEAGLLSSGRGRPLAVWARFEQGGQPFLVASVHTANPFEWQNQARDVERLIAFARSRSEGLPMILGGDFNLTPFSWQLLKFVHLAELKWVQTFAASWPATRLLPIVLLDHILFTEEVDLVGIETGPRVGSDHLPITADLSLVGTR